MATREIVDPKAFCAFVAQALRKRGAPEFLVARAVRTCLKESPGLKIPGLSGLKVTLRVREVRRIRDQILRNVRDHCRQLYKKGSMDREACRIAAAVAAAEIADVFKEKYGIRI